MTGTNITFSKKDMDVNEYKRLSNITLRHKLKKRKGKNVTIFMLDGKNSIEYFCSSKKKYYGVVYNK